MQSGFMNTLPPRLIGRYTGDPAGPLLICLGSMHGNEPAGTQALALLFQMLEAEPSINPGFRFRGRIVGFRGNLRAIAAGQRYLVKDLNRLFMPAHIERISGLDAAEMDAEDVELLELLEAISSEVADFRPSQLVVLDLHTTTATGGIFAIASDDPESVRLGQAMHVPVVQGLLSGIEGTTLHYFTPQNTGLPTMAISFEAGQHRELASVHRAVAAIINCLRTLGCVSPEDVENRHDRLLIEYSKHLPKVAKLIYAHRISPADGFVMRPGYANFQAVRRGEVLAHDLRGPVVAHTDAHILMPLYQKQGNDGFFLVSAV